MPWSNRAGGKMGVWPVRTGANTHFFDGKPQSPRTVLQQTKQIVIVLLVLAFFPAASAPEERYLSIYAPTATYSLPVKERAGHEYVGLLELLEPLGRVSSQSNGRTFKLRYDSVDAEFSAGSNRAKIHGRNFLLAAPFVIESSRGFVSLNSLSALLPLFLGASADLHEGSRRLFIGDVAIQASFRLDAANPNRLLLSFSAPVNPTISTEPGKLRMVFKRDAVISPGSQTISFDNAVITRANYSENDGVAELDVLSAEPLMASFSNDRKTIVISAVPQPVAAGAQNSNPSSQSGAVSSDSNSVTQPASQGASASVSPTNTPGSNTNPSPVRRLLAVVDPAHGGDERGAALTDKLSEKDVTLGFARLLRHELEVRGFAVLLVRDSDVTVNMDQRSATANVPRAAIYISLHADSQGRGARVYTALLPLEGQGKGLFHAWNTAQSAALPASRTVSSAIVTELQKKDFPALASLASLRPLNNVFMPAVAVELAPGTSGISDLTSANYQQRAASAIADGVVSVRDQLGVKQ